MKKILITLCIVFVPVFVFASGNSDPVVARIGEKQFQLSDFNRWVSYGSEKARKEIEKNPKRKASMLRQIVTSMVIADQARKEGFDRRPDTKENLELLINNFLTIEYLDKAVAQKVTISNKDVKRYYNQNKDKFRQPEQVRARHILIKVNRTAPVEEQKQARKKAEGILARIQAGEDFATLATEFSEDTGTKQKGGDLGFFQRGRMVPEFEKAAFSLEPGKVSDIVHSNFGFHIIKVEDRKEPAIRPYEEIKEQLKKKLEVDEKKKAVDQYVEKMAKEAGVEIVFDNLFGTGADPHFK